MTPPAITVATITLVRDPGEEGLLRRSVALLASRGMPVFVSDGGSGAAFTNALHGLENVRMVAPAAAGLVSQVAAATEHACLPRTDYVLYTESDKEAFFESGLDAYLQEASSQLAQPSLVLAARSPGSFGTFPPVQRHTEATINDLCGESFGAPGDYSYGPFLMHRSLVPWIARAASDLGWGWRHFIFAVGHRLGHRIVHVAGEFACPDHQRIEDDRERLHRLKQLDQNVSGLQAGLTVSLE
jgi:hypothetical protein